MSHVHSRARQTRGRGAEPPKHIISDCPRSSTAHQHSRLTSSPPTSALRFTFRFALMLLVAYHVSEYLPSERRTAPRRLSLLRLFEPPIFQLPRRKLSRSRDTQGMTFRNLSFSPERIRPNHAMQRTAGRSAFQLSMSSTFNLQRCAPLPALADLVSR